MERERPPSAARERLLAGPCGERLRLGGGAAPGRVRRSRFCRRTLPLRPLHSFANESRAGRSACRAYVRGMVARFERRHALDDFGHQSFNAGPQFLFAHGADVGAAQIHLTQNFLMYAVAPHITLFFHYGLIRPDRGIRTYTDHGFKQS